MSDGNAEQIEFWNGSTASNWVSAEERMDALLAPLSEQVIERAAVRPGEAVLDVGCGCGATSRAMAEAGARVLGIDVSAPMLARARERSGADERMQFVEADAATFGFKPEFDLLFSRFGVMFFADPTAAFANLHGALKATGRLCFICWQAPARNPWLAEPMAAAQPFLPPAEAPDPKAPGPFAFADPEYVSQVLTAAGFNGVEVEAHPVEMRVGGNLEQAVEFYTRIGPLSGTLADLEPSNRTSAIEAIGAVLAPRATASGIAMPGACWIATARR